MLSEFLVIGVLGSLLLGPKKMAKLMADVARMKQQLSAKKAGLLLQLEEELSLDPVSSDGVKTVASGGEVAGDRSAEQLSVLSEDVCVQGWGRDGAAGGD